MMQPQQLSTPCPPREDDSDQCQQEPPRHGVLEKVGSGPLVPISNGASVACSYAGVPSSASIDHDVPSSSSKTPTSPVTPSLLPKKEMFQRSFPRSTANPVSGERLFLRKIAQMISDQQWIEMDEFLRSPSQVAAFRGGSIRFSAQGGIHMADSVNNATSAAAASMKNLSLGGPGGTDISPMEAVHFACRFNPPRTIIRHLASLYPDGVTCPDNMGRLPLHHAVRWGASYRLICFLLEKDKSAASVKDISGKTPLHLLCQKYAGAYDEKDAAEISLEESMLGAAKLLVSAAPNTIHFEDVEEMTPIEYAISSDCPLKVVRFLQKSSESSWKTLKLKMPDEDHAHIEEKINKDQQAKQKKLEMREMKRLCSRNMLPNPNHVGHQQQRGMSQSQSQLYDQARIHDSMRALAAMNEGKTEETESATARRPMPSSLSMRRQAGTRTAFAKSA